MCIAIYVNLQVGSDAYITLGVFTHQGITVELSPKQLAELHVVIGRVNALHAFCAVIARSLPPTVAAIAEANLKDAHARVEADALASPIAEPHLQEMTRVLSELQHVLHAATQSH